jgi:RNA polymerase sigma-70 factor (ECF subfamily)
MTWAFDGESRALDRPVQDHLGKHLQDFYQDLIEDSLPADLTRLVRRLERAIQARNEAPDRALMAELVEAIPHLRAFAISWTRNVDQAEDLVQETVLRAWDKRASFEPGTNLNAWLFTILRNQHFSQHRRKGREVEDVDGIYASGLVALPDQVDRLEMQDMSAALDRLHPDQREALLLIGAQGLSYEEVAEVTGVALGTVKSRVNRARSRLAALLGLDGEDTRGRRLSHAEG